MTMIITTVIPIVVLLAGLIFVHELGHFLVAKWAGVKVETFSLGIGKKILRKRWGETDYCLSMFPIGGYVKMYGDDPMAELPQEDRRRAFLAQPLGKRFAIVIAGPAFNLLFALGLYVLIPALGEEVPITRVAIVHPGSQAEQVGLRVGDEIIEIDGSAVDRISDFDRHLAERVEKPVRLKVKRANAQDFFLEVRPREIVKKDNFGDPKAAAEIPGLSFTAPDTFVGIDSQKSWAATVGVKTGDSIAKINGKGVNLWPEMVNELARLRGQPVTLEVNRGDGNETLNLNGTVPAEGDLGLYRLDLFVKELVSGGPAERAELRAGDHIVEVNSKRIESFDEFKDLVTKTGEAGGKLFVTIVREAAPITVQVVPESREIENPVTHQKTRQWIIGLVSYGNQEVPAEIRKVRITSPTRLVQESIERTTDKTTMMVKGLWKLVTGQSSMKALGGPILIADLARRSAKLGLTRFLELMALISINLFLLNLFPIPILDGGHIFVFFTYEAIARRPMPVRWVERFNQVGFVVIMLLMLVTFINDSSRYNLFSLRK